MRRYFALVHKDKDSAFGIRFPDLPAVYSAADEKKDILANATEALQFYFEDITERPLVSSIELLTTDSEIRRELASGAYFISVPFIESEDDVVIPKHHYDKLIEYYEDMEDEAFIQLLKEKRARGEEEESIPSEIVDRFLDGENPIKVWREHRGMTIKELADKAGIAVSYLSKLENDKEKTLIKALKKIAEALKLTVDDLI